MVLFRVGARTDWECFPAGLPVVIALIGHAVCSVTSKVGIVRQPWTWASV